MQQLFGTDGIRASVGEYPMTPAGIIQIGHAISQWALLTLSKSAKIIIGQDTRASCGEIKDILRATLLLYPFELREVGIIPTAGLSILLKQNDADFGIMITASHNQYFMNGLKIIMPYGKLDYKNEAIITDFFYSKKKINKTISQGQVIVDNSSIEKIINFVVNTNESINLNSLNIIVDSAHGSCSTIASAILRKCNVAVKEINNNPNGTNINAHCGSLYPQQLQKIVIETKADLGIAFDGDGDRIVAVNRNGVIKDGDDILAFLSTHSNYSNEHTLVGTIMSNQGLVQHLSSQQKKLIRTEVGDRAVSKKLYDNNLCLGAEPSGHVVLADLLPCGDGLLTMIKMLETIITTNNKDISTFTKWPQVLMSIPITKKKDLNSPELKEIINFYEKKQSEGRIYVRYSGTEPLLRTMVESPDRESIHALAQELTQQLAQALAGE